MAIKFEEKAGGKILEVCLSGKLAKEDYKTLVPAMNRLIEQHHKIRLLVTMQDFHGWTPGGLWEDAKSGLQHWNEVERLAMVGETKWQHGIGMFCKPFTTATVRYFNQEQMAEARQWIEAA